MKGFVFFLILFFGSNLLFSQEEDKLIIKNNTKTIDLQKAALKPAKAGFYSAILPGLGHVSNKYNYIKIPIVYAGLGSTSYFYLKNDKKYNEYRDLFKKKKLNNSATEFSFDYLEQAQKLHKKQRDLSMLLTVGVYVLQVVWASVDAHLEYHNTNQNLSFSPSIIHNPTLGKSTLGAGLIFSY